MARQITQAMIKKLVRNYATSDSPRLASVKVKILQTCALGHEQFVVKVNRHQFIARYDCPVCCVHLLLSSLHRAILSSRSELTAFERLLALKTGRELISFWNEVLAEIQPGHKESRTVRSVVNQFLSGWTFLRYEEPGLEYELGWS